MLISIDFRLFLDAIAWNQRDLSILQEEKQRMFLERFGIVIVIQIA